MSKRKRSSSLTTAALVGTVLLMASCGGEVDSPGVEYMPDMYRSPAVEAYVDYGQDPYHFGDSLAKAQRVRPSARKPVAGTIAFSEDPAKAAYNMPYPYKNTPEDYELAGLNVKSPIAMTQATVDQGKVIYTKFCQQCHGETGMGDGAVVAKGGHPPPNAYSGPLKTLPEGKMFHTITFGKGAMGSHASQLNKEERWLVIQYVKFLQNGGKMTSTPAADSTSTATATAQAAH